MTVQEWKISVVHSNPQLIRHIQMGEDTDIATIRKLIRCAFNMQKEITGNLVIVSGFLSNETGEQIPENASSGYLSSHGKIWQFQESDTMQFAFRMELISERNLEHFGLPFVNRARGVNLPDRYCNSSPMLNDILSSWDNHYGYYSSSDGGYIRVGDFTYKAEKTARSIRRIFDPDYADREIHWERTLPYVKILNTIPQDELRSLVYNRELEANLFQKKTDLCQDIAQELCDDPYMEDLFFQMDPEEYESIVKVLRGEEPFVPPFLEAEFPDLADLCMVSTNRSGEVRIAKEAAEYFQDLENADNTINHLSYLKFLQLLKACLNLLLIFTKGDAKRIWEACFPEEASTDFDELWNGDHVVDPSFIIPELCLIADDIYYNSYRLDDDSAEALIDSPILHETKCYLPDREELRSLAQGILLPDKVRQEFNRVLMFYGHVSDWNAGIITEQIAVSLNVGETEKEISSYITDIVGFRKNSKGYEQLMKLVRKHKDNIRQAPLRGFTMNEMQKEKKE